MTVPAAEKVVVAHPMGAQVSGRFLVCWTGMLFHDFGHNRRILDGGDHLHAMSGANVTNPRNQLTRSFLDGHTADWLLWLDTDMTFDGDLVDKLVASAHRNKLRMVGALCFSVHPEYGPLPTLYELRDNVLGRRTKYAKGSLVRGVTGTGCLLVHRSVLEAVRSKFPPPFEFFQETAFDGVPIGEDITFCLRALGAGFECAVDASIRCGHEKPFVVDERMFDGGRNRVTV